MQLHIRVLFLVGRELEYPRNDVLLRAFQRFAQVDVVGVERRPASLVRNSARLSVKALPKIVSSKYDLIFVGFYGHLLMLPTEILAHRPILFDAFVSTYDTLVEDRGSISSRSFSASMAHWLDRQACLGADHVLMDTNLHIQYFVDTFRLQRSRFSALPVGCNEDLFSPRPNQTSQDDSRANDKMTRVLYYSSYLPLHGVETVVRAAEQLQSEAIHFRLVGAGQTLRQARRLAESIGLSNLDFVPPIPLRQLPHELASADICLGGHFGMSEKAGRVVPGKVYQVLAMGRPLIAGDTPANRELLSHGENAILSAPGDESALSDAILAFHCDPVFRRRLAIAGRQLYEAACSEAIITHRLKQVCERLF